MSKYLLPLDSYKKYYLQFSPIWKYYQQNDVSIPFKYCCINSKFMGLYSLRQIQKGRLAQSTVINYLSNLQKFDYNTHRLQAFLNLQTQQKQQMYSYISTQTTQQIAKLKSRYLQYLGKIQLAYKQEQFEQQMYNYYVFFKTFQEINQMRNLDELDYSIIYKIKHNIYTLLLLGQIKSFIWPHQGRQQILNYLFTKIQQGWTDIDTLRTIVRSFIIKVPYYIDLIKLINELLNSQQHSIRRIKFTRDTIPQLTDKQYKIFFKQVVCYLRYLVTHFNVQKHLYTKPHALKNYLKVLQSIEITQESCHLDLCEYVAVYSLNLQLISILDNYIYLKFDKESQVNSFKNGLKTMTEINEKILEKGKKLGFDQKVLTYKDVQYLSNCKIKIAKIFKEQIRKQLLIKQLKDMNILHDTDIKIKMLELAIIVEAQSFISLVVKQTKFNMEQYLQLCQRYPAFLHFIIHKLLEQKDQVKLPYKIECYILYKQIYEKHTNYKFVIKDIYQLRHLLLHSNHKKIPIKQYKRINMTEKLKYFLQNRRLIFKMNHSHVGYYPFMLYYWGAHFDDRYNLSAKQLKQQIDQVDIDDGEEVDEVDKLIL